MVLPRKRATVRISWALDPVPGWNNDPADVAKMLDDYLQSGIPHYDPKVYLVDEQTGQRTLVTTEQENNG